MLKQFDRQAKKAVKDAERKDKKPRFYKRKVIKLKSAVKSHLKRSPTWTQATGTGNGSRAQSFDFNTDSASLTYPNCRFLDSPFGALFIPPPVQVIQPANKNR